MRLQAESRRISTQLPPSGPIPLDLRSPSLATSKASKRASFQPPQTPTALRPLTTGHRRISSLSDPGPHPDTIASPPPDVVNIIDGAPPSPATHTFAESRNGDGSVIKTKRLSLLQVRREPSPPPSLEVEALKAELINARKEVEYAKRDAIEANDRREASEACIKALREFIAEQALGMQDDDASVAEGRESPVKGLKGLMLPPLPSENTAQEEVQPAKKGWGLRLWSQPATPALEPAPAEVVSPSATSTPLTSFVSSWTRSVSSGTSQSVEAAPAPPLPTQAPAPPSKSTSPPVAAGLTRKFSLFKRGSAATTTSVSSASVHTPELVTSSESTSPQTDTRSLASGVLSLDEEPLTAKDLDAKRAGDVTPTLGPESLEVVAL